MLNSYTLEVCAKAGKPCIVVSIYHVMLHGVYFFKTMQEANSFVECQKIRLNPFVFLTYNSNSPDENSLKLIKEVLNNDNIVIGENGKTYMRNEA